MTERGTELGRLPASGPPPTKIRRFQLQDWAYQNSNFGVDTATVDAYLLTRTPEGAWQLGEVIELWYGKNNAPGSGLRSGRYYGKGTQNESVGDGADDTGARGYCCWFEDCNRWEILSMEQQAQIVAGEVIEAVDWDHPFGYGTGYGSVSAYYGGYKPIPEPAIAGNYPAGADVRLMTPVNHPQGGLMGGGPAWVHYADAGDTYVATRIEDNLYLILEIEGTWSDPHDWDGHAFAVLYRQLKQELPYP